MAVFSMGQIFKLTFTYAQPEWLKLKLNLAILYLQFLKFWKLFLKANN